MPHFKVLLQETTTTILVWKVTVTVVEFQVKDIQVVLEHMVAALVGQLAVTLFTAVVVVAEPVAPVSQHQAVMKWAQAAQD
jgi:hypothetical protein